MTRIDCRLTVDRDFHEFRSTDEDLKTTFRLKNDSSCQITITSIKPSCSCISASVGSKDLGPGEVTDLQIQTTRPALGTVESLVAVETTASAPIHLRLIAHATSDQPRVVSISPQNIRLSQDKTPVRDLHIISLEDHRNTERNLKLSCDVNGVTLEKIRDVSTLLPDHHFARIERTYRVRLNSGKQGGVESGVITLTFGDPSRPFANSRSIPIEVFR